MSRGDFFETISTRTGLPFYRVRVCMETGYATLSSHGPTEHLVEFKQADCAWRLQFWSDDVSSERVDAEEEKIRVFVENSDDEALEFQGSHDAPALVVEPKSRALVFEDTVWELMMVNRSVETEQAILSSQSRSGSVKIVFEPDLEGEKDYRVKVSLRRAIQR